MRQRSGVWVMAIGLLMAAYGGAVLWGVYAPARDGTMAFASIVTTRALGVVVLAILIAAVGAYCFIRELVREPEDRTPSMLADAVQPYWSAWSRLWRTKWLLWVYGTIALVQALGSSAVSFLAYRYHQTIRQDQVGGVFGSGEISITQISNWLQGSLQGASWAFSSSLQLSKGAPLSVLALFLVVWWALPRISRLPGDESARSRAKALSVCLVVAALAEILWTALWLLMAQRLWVAQAESDLIQRLWPPLALTELAVGVVVHAAVVGGVVGVLAYGSREDVKTAFLRNSVRCFAPLAIFWLIISIACLVPTVMLQSSVGGRVSGTAEAVSIAAQALFGLLDLAILLLIFAPFAIVVGGRGPLEAMKHSAGLWKRLWPGSAGLVAVGAFLYGVVMLVLKLSSYLYKEPASLWPLSAFIVSAAGTLLGLILLLALLEFYQANATDREPSLAPVPDPSP